MITTRSSNKCTKYDVENSGQYNLKKIQVSGKNSFALRGNRTPGGSSLILEMATTQVTTTPLMLIQGVDSKLYYYKRVHTSLISFRVLSHNVQHSCC
jgi:hypothetical protein